MADSPVRVEVLTVEHDGETRYGVMEVRRFPTGLGCVIHYGPFTQGLNQTDWGAGAEEQRNMRLMAQGLFEEVVSKTKHT